MPLAGCFIFFEEHGKGGDECLLPPSGDDPKEPGAAIAPQRNPHNLICESFGGGGGTCDPNCGPCPLSGEENDTDQPPKPNALAPIPSWGFCTGFCESLDEATCELDGSCRVIRDARCAVEGNCETDFVTCVETDQFVDTSTDCNAITDADSCSRNPSCTAFHREEVCPFESPVPPQCTRDFAFCANEGQDPGRCFEQAACDQVPPTCPSGSTPGVANGCFTNVCIPNDLCELAPNQ